MRFFSTDWLELEDEAESQRVIDEYDVFVSGLVGPVGWKIRDFINAHSVHDALLDRLEIDTHRDVIQFDLVAGDSQVGYFHLRLRYVDARVVGLSNSELSDILDSRSSVVRYDEFDLVDSSDPPGKHMHRFLLWPATRREFGIEFGDFDLTTTPLQDRRYENYGESFVVVERSSSE